MRNARVSTHDANGNTFAGSVATLSAQARSQHGGYKLKESLHNLQKKIEGFLHS